MPISPHLNTWNIHKVQLHIFDVEFVFSVFEIRYHLSTGAPNENIVQNHLDIALLKYFSI